MRRGSENSHFFKLSVLWLHNLKRSLIRDAFRFTSIGLQSSFLRLLIPVLRICQDITKKLCFCMFSPDKFTTDQHDLLRKCTSNIPRICSRAAGEAMNEGRNSRVSQRLRTVKMSCSSVQDSPSQFGIEEGKHYAIQMRSRNRHAEVPRRPRCRGLIFSAHTTCSTRPHTTICTAVLRTNMLRIGLQAVRTKHTRFVCNCRRRLARKCWEEGARER